MRALTVLLAVLALPAAARTLEVGDGAEFRLPSEAIAKARPGDLVRIAPGEYFDCTTIDTPGLTIEGAGPGTLMTDRTCGGKAILVIHADATTVRNLVLARARVPDLNGAGIRLEGQGLTLDRVVFRNDQVGLLTVDGPGEVRIADCRFEGGGIPGDRATYALWVGGVARLVVERTVFTGIKGGIVSSAADRTELIGNRIELGIEPGAGHAVRASGGDLVVHDTTFALGPYPALRDAAILAQSARTELRGNRLLNTTNRPQRLLIDWSGSSPVLSGNAIPPGDTEATSAGAWRHRAGNLARGALAEARAAAGATKRALKDLLGR